MQRFPSKRLKDQRGAAAVEFVLVGMTLVVPLTFALFFTAQILWIWHSVAEATREGARYASTHCYQSGTNVRNYISARALPAMPERDQFANGSAEILVTYYGRTPESNELSEFSCDNECSIGCIPDVVKVQIRNYEYRNFLTYWGIPPIQLPDFQTTVPIEGAGCDPDTGTCIP